jgi:outer membrane immunogenic protein
MKTKLIALLSGVIGLGAAGAASAADMAVKARPAPPPAPIFTWTGFYLGGHGGCAYSRSNITQGPFTDADPGDLGTVFALDRANGGGCYGGVQGGYNYQFANNWVVGVEADGSWGEIRSKTQLNEVETTEIEALGLYNQKLESFGTVRGRFGYSWNLGTAPALWYVTGGWAWARNKLTTAAGDTVGGVQPLPVTATRDHSGWTVGTGLEVALDRNWSFKGEYLYMDLGSKTYNTSLITDDGALPAIAQANLDLKLHTVRIGVNYRFNPWGAPLVAKY